MDIDKNLLKLKLSIKQKWVIAYISENILKLPISSKVVSNKQTNIIQATSKTTADSFNWHMTFLNAQSVVGGQIANKEWQLYTVLLQLIPSCANQIKLVGKWSTMYPNASYAWPWCCVPSYCWRRRNSLINWGQKVKPQRTMGWLVAVGESQNIVLIHYQATTHKPCVLTLA